MLYSKLDYKSHEAVELQAYIKQIKERLMKKALTLTIPKTDSTEEIIKTYIDPRKLRVPGTITLDVLDLANEMLTIINADNGYYVDSSSKLHIISKMHPKHFENIQKKMYRDGKYLPSKFKQVSVTLKKEETK